MQENDTKFIWCVYRELREETNQLSNRENDHMAKRKDMEQRYETAQTEISSLKNDLRLALQRIADLQQAMEDVDDDDGSSERYISIFILNEILFIGMFMDP